MAIVKRSASDVCDGLEETVELLLKAWQDGNHVDSKIHIEQLGDYIQDFRRIVKDQLYRNLK